jgi:L-ascorbate metabolism protein UlaG (beta-lactamase superfamily)
MSSSGSKGAVALTYLGAAGWKVEAGTHVLLVDPYFSRVEVDRQKTSLTPDATSIDRYAPAHADAILVGHSHFDHLLDVPEIAKRTGARVVGTQSTFNVAHASGVPDRQLTIVGGGEILELAPFSVRVIRALHAPIGLPSTTISEDVKLPMTADGYVEGGTLQYMVAVQGRAILFIGTANFVESELQGLRPDIAVVATGAREKVPDYSCRLMRALGRPPLVLTNHFDALWEALGPAQMDIEDADREKLARFADEIHACAPATQVVIPTHLQPMSI